MPRVGRYLVRAAWPKDRCGWCARAAVVQKRSHLEDLLCETDPPQRRRAPLHTDGDEVRTCIGQSIAHVVEQEIRIRMDLLVRDDRDRMVAGLERRDVTARAAEVAK